MARVFDEINILLDGTRLALKETEQLDMINNMSYFCVRYGDIFDAGIFKTLEDSLLEAIDFGNQIDYTYEEFIPLYQKTLTDFKALTDWYMNIFQKTPVISFVLTAYAGGDLFARTMKSLFKYRNPEVEIVVMDCTETGSLKNVIKSFGDSGKVQYFKSGYGNDLINEINANMKCTGRFIFPLEEGDKIIIEVIPDLITMLKNNPLAGIITCPGSFEGDAIDDKLLWKIAQPESDLLLRAREIQRKTGFGYKNEFVDLGKEGVPETLLESCGTSVELYRTIAYQLSDIYEFIVFGKPLYSDK